MDDYQLVKKSKWVNGKWYQEQYPDVALLAMDPVEHYLKVGARLKRDPCKRFDTAFYLERYPDVGKSGINPLVHYLRYGKYEGRSPKDTPVDVLFHNLWGGHSITALEKLNKLHQNSSADTAERVESAWQAARWYSFVGEHKQALALARKMEQLDSETRLRKDRVLLESVSLQGLGRGNESEPLLKEYSKRFPKDADIYFFLANVCDRGDNARLALINQAFNANGYATIELSDLKQGLEFANIRGTDVEPRETDQSEKVSIIIPAYSAEDRLHVALESLLAQTWKNIEVIVVDDCSPDGTFEVAQQYSFRDARVIPIKQEVNGGAYKARNRGLKIATGDFITTHDSDDWSHPQKLENQVLELRKSAATIGVVTHWIRCFHDLQFTQNWRPSEFLVHYSHSSFMFRRSVLQELGEWDEVRIGADTEFIWRVGQRYGKDAVNHIIPEVPMAFALDDEGSLTRTKATHVSTVYFGLRHIYRQICAYWHRTGEHLKLVNGEQRDFRVPKGMLTRDDSEEEFDLVLVSDFSSEALSSSLLDFAQHHLDGKQRVALLHWPMFGTRQFKLTDAYFELILAGKAEPVVYGDNLRVPQILLASESLVAFPVDAMPAFSGVQEVKVLRDTSKSMAVAAEFQAQAENVVNSLFGCHLEVIEQT